MNKGLFHPILNIMGTKKASDDKYWYDTTQSFTSVADCFNTSKLLTASGNVASGKSGRPDGRYYDVLYAENMIECREYAKILNRDEVNLIITDKEENGVEEVIGIGIWQQNVVETNSTATATAIQVSTGTGNNFIIGRYVTFITSSGIKVHSRVNSTYANYIVLDNTFSRVNGDIYTFIIQTTTKPILSSNTKLSTDLIGNPQFYPQVLKDRLASGVGIVGINPLLVEA